MHTQLVLYYRKLATEQPSCVFDRILLALLIPCGWLYGAINMLRSWLYRKGWLPSYRSPVPVISVGNIAVGGTGKTPLVDYLLRQQIARGRKVAVVSRGYGGEKHSEPQVVCAGSGPLLSAQQCGDEPYLLAQGNPEVVVIIAAKRAAGIRLALEQFAIDLVVLDDGYQHLAVQRDLNLLLLDNRYPVGNGQVLPAGLLREFPAAAQRADLCILTRCADLYQAAPAICAGKDVVHVRQSLARSAKSLGGEHYAVATLNRGRCIAFAGIANPDDFFAALPQVGIDVVATLPLVDHCKYTPQVLEAILTLAQDADYLLTTEKDAVKLRPDMFPVPCCSLALTLEVHEADLLDQRVEALLKSSA